MKDEIKKYLEKLKEKFDNNNNYYQAYKIIKKKVVLIDIASTKKELNELINNNLIDLVEEKASHIIKITYNISLKNYLSGPLSIQCVINEITESGKITKKNMKVNTIYYTEKELEKYKLLKNDFKLLINGLLNETIDSNPLKIYTRKDLD